MNLENDKLKTQFTVFFKVEVNGLLLTAQDLKQPMQASTLLPVLSGYEPCTFIDGVNRYTFVPGHIYNQPQEIDEVIARNIQRFVKDTTNRYVILDNTYELTILSHTETVLEPAKPFPDDFLIT